MIENLVTNDACHFKALLAGDGVDYHVAMYTDKMLRVEDAVLILSRCVDDLRRKVLTFVTNDLAEGILDCGIIAVDPMLFHVLDCE